MAIELARCPHDAPGSNLVPAGTVLMTCRPAAIRSSATDAGVRQGLTAPPHDFKHRDVAKCAD
jgi:hypothetical protein